MENLINAQEPIEEEGAGGEIKAAERGCPECPRGASAHRAPSPCATCGPSYKDKVLGAMIERLAGLEVDAGVAPDARRAWAVAISALEAVHFGGLLLLFGNHVVNRVPVLTRITHDVGQGNRAALQAVKRACQEGVDPEDAMEQVVAVLGRPAERKGAGGAKNKQQQKQKPKDKKHVVKHVACVCM